LVFGSLITAVARNPSLTKQLFSYSILGFALTEAIIHFNGCVLILFAMCSNTHNFAYAKLFAYVISRSLLGFTVEKLMERIQQSCLVLS
jgi:hypothetical protein